MAVNTTELARIEIANSALSGAGLPVVVVSGGGGGLGGDASAANQALELAKLTSVDGKLPALTLLRRKPLELPVGGSGLTDTELRAVPVPVSAAALPLPAGAATQATLAIIALQLADILTELGQKLEPGNAVAVSNLPATQAVSAVALPLPAGASTEATLALVKAKTDNFDVLLSTRTKPADQQHAVVDSSALPLGAAADATVSAVTTAVQTLDTDFKADIGTLEGRPAAYTVLDRLYQLGVKIDTHAKVGASEATLQRLVATMTRVPAVPLRPSLLHRV